MLCYVLHTDYISTIYKMSSAQTVAFPFSSSRDLEIEANPICHTLLTDFKENKKNTMYCLLLDTKIQNISFLLTA